MFLFFAYFYLGVIFSLILFSQLLASFLFTKLSERMNFVLLLFLSASMIFTAAFFDPRKEIAVLLVCMIFYLIKYTSLRVEVVLHDSISDNLRATYESFLSTVGRLSLLVFFYLSAYMVNIFGFLSLVYILGIYLFVCSVFFRRNSKKISVRICIYHYNEYFMWFQRGMFCCQVYCQFGRQGGKDFAPLWQKRSDG
ncbi:hypothetical protein ME1_00016 [Bartonella vinsonii subsp. arupensis OK-94-513]|uniref:Uncharacterized protein n=1 Tax=Bartonella vinsonii subsp. arupensis OK-94-513 TaxID=1094562 RepID=J0QXM0_BARVI|nr:hypothetical protein ME1_00016 [Bartonella vinsonii subsp. arupensis OK-94-513]